MSTFEILAVLSSLNMLALELVMRALQRERDQGWFLSMLGSCAGGAALLFFIPYTTLNLSLSTMALLVTAGTFWAISIIAEFKSHVSLPVGIGALLSSLRTIFLVIIGAVFFRESFTLFDALGTAFAVVGVLIACAREPNGNNGELPEDSDSRLKQKRPRLMNGVWPRALAALAAGAAIVTEKALAERAPIEVIITGGYLIPAALYLLYRPQDWRAQCSLGPRRRTLMIGLYMLLYIAIGPLFVTSFVLGNLGETFVISQSRLVLLMILGALLLGERTGLRRSCVGMAITLLGLYLMIGVD